MEALIKKYEQKLIQAGLCGPEENSRPIIGGLDDRLIWNREDEQTIVLEKIFDKLNINSLVYLQPCSPYSDTIGCLAKTALASNGYIEPADCETRTFLHDLPVVDRLDAHLIIPALKKRKCVIIQGVKGGNVTGGPAIIAHGTVSPEQGFATVSSVCFACFVKFFADYLELLKKRQAPDRLHHVYDRISPFFEESCGTAFEKLAKFPFENEESVYSAVIEAGQKTVEYGLVDSYFGNVSYLWNNTLYISQTGSSLDELAGCIDPVPLDGSTSAGLTASSELTAHINTIEQTGCRAILHGHPKFSVILSMDCDPEQKKSCKFSGRCHIKCPEKRFVRTTPIVPGEVGTGPTGLCQTLPAAFKQSDSVIVWGHGLFTIGEYDFNSAFLTLLNVENHCKKLYTDMVRHLR